MPTPVYVWKPAMLAFFTMAHMSGGAAMRRYWDQVGDGFVAEVTDIPDFIRS